MFTLLGALVMPLLAVLICVREGDRSRVGIDRTYLEPDAVYSRYIREQLQDIPRNRLNAGLPPLSADSSGREWHAGCQALHMHVVAACLLEPLWEWNLQRCLSKAQRAVRKYWLLTRHGASHLFYVRVVETATLARPVPVHAASNLGLQLFLPCTAFSAAVVGDTPVATMDGDGPSVQARVAEWRTRFAHMLPTAPSGSGCIDTLLCLPASHALLIGHKKWTTYAFPFPPARRSRAGLGLNILKGFLPARPAVNEDHLVTQHGLLSAESLESIADSIRSLQAGQRQPEAHINRQLGMLQQTLDDMYLEVHAKSTKAFQMDFLVRCLLLGGHLRSQHSLQDALKAAILAAVHIPELRQHLLAEITSKQLRVPSPTTLYRHRLTLHVGFCMWMAAKTQELLNTSEGVVRYMTADSSLQGAHDWFLAGATTIAVDCLALT